MRKLRSCDFCGADATGVYEVLPPELNPSEDEQRRIVLCDECLATLETVLEPLLARATDGEASAPGADREADAGAPSAAASDESPGEGLLGTSSDVVSERVAESQSDAERDTDTETADASPSDADAEATDAGTAMEERSDDPADSPDSGASGRSDPVSRPEGYRKVLRILGNRDGALSRADMVELVENAYGLSDAQCNRVIDAALENGDLVEEAGTLRRA